MNKVAVLEEAVLQGFVQELSKIAVDLHHEIPLVKMAQEHPEELAEILKEAGVFSGLASRLGQYGKNISAYAQQAKDTLTGGGFARQMRELGSSNPMTSSAAQSSLQGTMGPMRERSLAAAAAAQSRMAPSPAEYGLAVPAPRPLPTDPRVFGLGAQPAARPLPGSSGSMVHSSPSTIPELAGGPRPGMAARRGPFAGSRYYDDAAAEQELGSLFGAPFRGRYT